jgi:DNA-binding NtrC family response regulator
MNMLNNERRILVVDDEINVCRALMRSLSLEGYQVVTASQPAQALEILKKDRIDMVISDHLMPNMTGLDLLKIVRTRYPDCVRMLLTGHADMQTAIDAINQGQIYRFLAKPWDDDALKATLHLAFEELDIQRENRRMLAAARQRYDAIKRLAQGGTAGIGQIVAGLAH